MATAKKTKAVVKATSTLPALDAGFTAEQRELIRNLIAKDCNDDELALFLQVCQSRGLNPFTRQIYAIKRGNQMTIQTGIDGARSEAARTGRYMPGKEPTFAVDGKTLVSATVYIKVLGPDKQWHETSDTAFLVEYQASSPTWAKMPKVMLSKCAEMRVLRRAFPDNLGGIYADEEMEQVGNTTPDLSGIANRESQTLAEGNPSLSEQFPEPGRTDQPQQNVSVSTHIIPEIVSDSDTSLPVTEVRSDDSVEDIVDKVFGPAIISEQDRKHLFAVMKDEGLVYADLKPKILAAYKITSLKNLPKDRLDELIRRLKVTGEKERSN
jgi:phage recombination protein Bet